MTDKQEAFWAAVADLPDCGLTKPLVNPRAAFQLVILPAFVVTVLVCALVCALIVFVPVTVYGLFCLAFQPVRVVWRFFAEPFEGD